MFLWAIIAYNEAHPSRDITGVTADTLVIKKVSLVEEATRKPEMRVREWIHPHILPDVIYGCLIFLYGTNGVTVSAGSVLLKNTGGVFYKF